MKKIKKFIREIIPIYMLIALAFAGILVVPSCFLAMLGIISIKALQTIVYVAATPFIASFFFLFFII